MTIGRCLIAGALGCLIAASAALAQTSAIPEDDQPDIFVNLDVGYNSSYRNASWTPVDVVVNNELSDLDGYVEVRTYDPTGQRQSPVYRLPVECPKDSIKRFRLNVYINNASRVEAMLYEDDRQAIEVPSYLQQTPVEEDSLMGIVVDDDPMNFGFLYAAVQSEIADLRFYRFSILPNMLNLLPDIDPAYDVFNVLVFGEFDPAYMPEAQRQCIRRYIENGGLLVICTGAFAGNYRGSWVEDLMGVRMGTTETLTEDVLAASVLPEGKRQGADPTRTCDWVPLEPLNDGVQTLGEERVLATRNPYGKGHVVTLSVDAASGALQKVNGFRELWSDFARHPLIQEALPFEAVAAEASYTLPLLSGVTIRPAREVAIYLLLYVGIGIVANWLFWNYMKRREMAWVCLIGFSVLFSGYAIFSGAAGWAKSAELHNVDVYYLPQDSGLAIRKSASGILSARTKFYDADVTQQPALVREIDMMKYSDGNRPWQNDSTPFAAVQGDEPRVEALRVGSSELRLAMAESVEPAGAPSRGHLTIDDEGFSLEYAPAEGWELEDPRLYLNGYFHPLNRVEGAWSLAMSLDDFYAATAHQRSEHIERQHVASGYYYYGHEITREKVDTLLLGKLVQSVGGVYNDASLGPFIVGKRALNAPPALDPDQETEDAYRLSLVVAEVPVTWASGATYPLTSLVGNHAWTQYAGSVRQYWNENDLTIRTRSQIQVLVGITDRMRQDADSYIEADIYWEPAQGDPEVILAPPEQYFGPTRTRPRAGSGLAALMDSMEDADNPSATPSNTEAPLSKAAEWLQANRVSVELDEDGRPLMHARYRIRDWRGAEFHSLNSDTAIALNLVAVPHDAEGNPDIRYRAAFRAVHPKDDAQSGGFPQWQ